MNFIATEAYSKWLACEPVPEYKDDIEREKRIKEKELAEKAIQLTAYVRINDRIKFFEKVIENKSDFTEGALKFEVDKSMFFFLLIALMLVILFIMKRKKICSIL